MCVTPVTIHKGTPDQMTVGCGRCIPCHIKYCNQWAFRFKLHANTAVTHYCVTLTYAGEHLPKMRVYSEKHKQGKVYMTLRRSHASSFFKTLRNHHNKRYKNAPNKPKISYLICGEYGDKFKRPHYHAIVFGAHADDIVKSWPYGAIYFGANNPDATVKYALKYVMKSRLWKSMGGSYERPFINVSKGIGASLIERGSKTYQVVNTETGEFHKYKITCYNSNVPEQIEFGGIRMLLPRYYTKKLGITIDTEEQRIAAIDKAREFAERLSEQGITAEQWKKDYHNWLYRLNKEHHYDNRIFRDVDPSLISKIT